MKKSFRNNITDGPRETREKSISLPSLFGVSWSSLSASTVQESLVVDSLFIEQAQSPETIINLETQPHGGKKENSWKL